MIAKLPRWVWVGAWALAFVAGAVNVVALLGFEHQSVTHLTGANSMLSAAVAAGDGSAAARLAAIIVAFTAGCVLSGVVIQDDALRFGRRYGVALLIEAGLLAAAAVLLEGGSVLGVYCASGACGLQNAMVSTYSGAVVRTTHVTGMFTDVGIVLGHALRGVPADLRRLRLYALLISGFLIGGVVGAVAFGHVRYATLFIASGLTAAACLAYEVGRLRGRRDEPRA
jgi:uncharacterized membrane protein YoaK (UPF0700 family)